MLIINHLQVISLLGEAEDGAREVLSSGAVQPLGTDDPDPIGVREGGLTLACKLGPTVRGERRGGSINGVGSLPLAVEYEVGGDDNERNTGKRTAAAENATDRCVHAVGQVLVGLGPIHIGECRGMNDTAERAVILEEGGDLIVIGEIDAHGVYPRGVTQVRPQGRQLIGHRKEHLATQHPGSPRDEDLGR